MLTGIITLELNNFNCDLQTIMRDKGSRKRHRHQTSPHSVTQAINSIAYKPVRYHFQERKFVRLIKLFPIATQ